MYSCLVTTVTRRAWTGGLLFCGLFLLSTGCGPDYKARGSVKGKVTTGKKNLTTGTVVFHGKNGLTGTGAIDPDGNYQVLDAPLGECTITVTVNMPTDASVRMRMAGKSRGPAMPEGPKPPPGVEGPHSDSPAPPLAKMPKEVVPIDSKYSNPETSGLKFTVQKGEQTHDIDL